MVIFWGRKVFCRGSFGFEDEDKGRQEQQRIKLLNLSSSRQRPNWALTSPTWTERDFFNNKKKTKLNLPYFYPINTVVSCWKKYDKSSFYHPILWLYRFPCIVEQEASHTWFSVGSTTSSHVATNFIHFIKKIINFIISFELLENFHIILL